MYNQCKPETLLYFYMTFENTIAEIRAIFYKFY